MTARSDTTAHRGPAFAAHAGRESSRQGEELDSLRPALDRIIDHVRDLVRCDVAAFQIVDPLSARIEPVASWFASPALRATLEPFLRKPYERRRPGLTEAALERGGPLLLPRLEDWEASPLMLASARDALGERAADEAWKLYRSCSVIACPVQPAVGRAFGVLVIASIDPERPLTRGDLRAVQALADLASLALERSELLQAEAHRASEERLLKRAAAEVSSSLKPDHVYGSIVEHALSLTGATKALLTRLQPAGNELVAAAAIDFSEETLRMRHMLHDSMLGQVARTRRPYLSTAEDAARWNQKVVASEPLGSFIHAPIELGPRLFGVLTVGHEEPNRFDEEDLELLVKLARSSAAGIANAIDFERERRVARALTLGFVPESLPEVPGFEVGLLYEPAANQPTGGDVYGVWRTPSGQVAVLVGDVAGKGVQTAALSAMARFFIEARSWDTPSPAEVLDQANAMLRSRLPNDTFVTAFFGLLAGGGLTYCNAGHLSPILVRAEGGRGEPGGRGLPLGVDESPGYRTSELALGDGDLLLAYTDGLIEARREGELFGTERLGRVIGDWDHDEPVSALVRHVHEHVSDWADGLSDDAVALALRRRS